LKIWLKMLLGIAFGIILGIIIPQKIVFVDNIFKFISDLAINLLLYSTIAYVLVKSFLGYYELKNNKFDIKKIFGIFFGSFVISLIISIIFSIGLMNLSIFQPDKSFSIFQNKAEPIKTFSFEEIILRIINTNMFSSFEGPVQFILPVIFIGFIFAISAFYSNKKAVYFIDIMESFDVILEKITHSLIELFPIGAIFVVANLLRTNAFSFDKLQFILRPMIGILIISVILLIFYSFFISLVLKKNTLKFYTGLLGAALTGLVSGNTAASIIPLNEHLKRNLGVKKELSDALTPIGMILNKSGTVIISSVTIMTVILGYSPNILDFKLQLAIFFLLVVFSFALDGVNEVGFLALVSVIMHIPALHLEQDSYLLFLAFVPILSRIGIFFDIITTGIFISLSAKFTDNLENKDFIDFI
jgi:Na+/H+-dicarboxylate symporter